MIEYKPNNKTAAILDTAYQLVGSVPYQVSARWLFYRLLQMGYYSEKADYKDKFLSLISRARHAFYNGWRPDTLADETREAIREGIGKITPKDWLNLYAEHLECKLDKWSSQDYYLELWFEARAMTDQFRHYTEYITLRPMGGQPSIPYKWQAAQELAEAARRYNRPLIVLYFGDLDPAGETIAEVVNRDVSTWCQADFTFRHCGLTLDQVQKYQVPENPEKPGQYQWEALPDQAAREIIEGAINPYLRHDSFLAVEETEDAVTSYIRGILKKAARQYSDN